MPCPTLHLKAKRSFPPSPCEYRHRVMPAPKNPPAAQRVSANHLLSTDRARRPGQSLRINRSCVVAQRFPERPNITEPPEFRTTKELVETVDDFVAAQSLLVQQCSTSLNTQPVSH
jgi:hypothetical protein